MLWLCNTLNSFFFSWASCVLLLSSVQNHTHERIQLLNSSGLCSVSGQQQPVAVSISSLQTGGSSVGAVFDFMGSSLSLISFCSRFSGQTLSALWWCGKCCDCKYFYDCAVQCGWHWGTLDIDPFGTLDGTGSIVLWIWPKCLWIALVWSGTFLCAVLLWTKPLLGVEWKSRQ